MSAAVEEQMVVKAIGEECPWESLPKRLQSTLHTKDEWHRRYLLPTFPYHFTSILGFALLQAAIPGGCF
jgi:hypothetical protein